MGSRIVRCPRLGRVYSDECLGTRWRESPAPSLGLFVEKAEGQNDAQLELTCWVFCRSQRVKYLTRQH